MTTLGPFGKLLRQLATRAAVAEAAVDASRLAGDRRGVVRAWAGVARARDRLRAARLLFQAVGEIVWSMDQRRLALENEAKAAILIAVADYAGRAALLEELPRIERPAVPPPPVSLAEAKAATAVAIADRSGLRRELDRLAADPALAQEARLLRRELAAQEALVAQWKDALVRIVASSTRGP